MDIDNSDTMKIMVDPIMAGIMKEAKAGDIIDQYANGRVKTPNYTMKCRGAYVLEFVPHWFPQFRATIKDIEVDGEFHLGLVIGNLYARPRGHSSIAYRHISKGRLQVSIPCEGLPSTLINGCVGRDLRDLVGWDVIPQGMTIVDAKHEIADNDFTGAHGTPRAARQPGITDQLHLTIGSFKWVEYAPEKEEVRDIPVWDDSPFKDSSGKSYASLEDFVTGFHPHPVDAKLCHYLAGHHSGIARLRIEYELDPGGRSHSPHLCLEHSYDRTRKLENLRLLNGAWLRRRYVDGIGGSIDWMIPIHLNNRTQIENVLFSYCILVLDEGGKISAFLRDDDSHSVEAELVNTYEGYSLLGRGHDPDDEDAPDFTFET